MAVYQETKDIDIERGDSHAKIVRFVAPGSVVLDVGVGAGTVGKYLSQQKQCVMHGLTVSKDEMRLAKPFYARLERMDLERQSLKDVFGDATYDYVVCADVLEHVRTPEKVLADAQSLLKPGGRLLVSIPNVGYVGVVADLIAGEFSYHEWGLLDTTHLRFFTRKSLLDLLAQAGFAALHLDRVVASPQHTEFARRRLDLWPKAAVALLLSNPDAFTYQFIVECCRAAEAPADSVPVEVPLRDPELTFAAELFWHNVGETYSPDRRIVALGRHGLERQTIQFVLPVDAAQVGGLRFDPCSQPGFITLFGLRVLDDSGAAIWSWRGDLASLVPDPATSMLPDMRGDQGVVIGSTTDDPRIEVRLPADMPSRPGPGWRIECEMSAPYSSDAMLFVQREKHRSGAYLTRIAELEAQIASSQATAAVLGQQQQSLTEQLTTVTSRVAAADESKAEVGAVRAQLDHMQRRLDEQIALAETRNALLASQNADASVLLAEIEAGKRELGRQDAQIEAQAAQIAGLKSLLESRDTDLSNQNGLLENQSAKLAEQSALLESQTTELAWLKAEREAVAQQAAKHGAELEAQANLLVTQHEDLARLRSELALAKQQLEKQDSELQARAAQLAIGAAELSALRTQLTERATQVAETRATLAEAEQQVSALRQEVTRLQSVLNQTGHRVVTRFSERWQRYPRLRGAIRRILATMR